MKIILVFTVVTTDLMEVTDKLVSKRQVFLSAGDKKAGPRSASGSSWLTLSSQLQPRSTVPVGAGIEAPGLESSSGMVGLYGGDLSRWFKLPCVPLLGAGFRPRRSESERKPYWVS